MIEIRTLVKLIRQRNSLSGERKQLIKQMNSIIIVIKRIQSSPLYGVHVTVYVKNQTTFDGSCDNKERQTLRF